MSTLVPIVEGKRSLCPSTSSKSLIRRARTSATSLSASTLIQLVFRPLLLQLQLLLCLLLNPRPLPLYLQRRHRRGGRVLESMIHLRRCLQALGFKRLKCAWTYLDYSPDHVCVDCHCHGLLRYVLVDKCQHIVCVFCLDEHACLHGHTFV